jgi:hypothetical protein
MEDEALVAAYLSTRDPAPFQLLVERHQGELPDLYRSSSTCATGWTRASRRL